MARRGENIFRRRHGFAGYTFHALRHSFATRGDCLGL